MSSYVTPKKNTQFIFYLGLVNSANRPQFLTNPAIGASDFKVSTDGGAFGNLGTTPSAAPGSSKAIKITLSTSEMNGDNVVVSGSSGSSLWDDVIVNIQTTARQIDDLAYASSGSLAVDANGRIDVGRWLGATINALIAGRVDSNAQVVGDKTSYALTAGEHTNIATDAQTGLTAQGYTSTRAGYLDTLNGLVQAIWDKATSALVTSGSIGKLLVDNIDVAISSRSTLTASAVWTFVTRTLTAFGFDVTVDTNNDKTGYSLDDGSLTASTFAAGAINAAAMNADTDTYQAKVWLIDDNAGAEDRYVVVFFKNSEPILSGITSPTIQVIKASDGSDLIAQTSLSSIGSTGLYKHDELADRVDSGSAYFAKVQASINGSTRSWVQTCGRDSES